MRLPPWFVRAAALCAATVNLFAVFYFGVRPWYLTWGTERDEATRPLPGDEAVPDVRVRDQTTRAIDIYASADQVWPWLAQLGQDRAGFYSYELLEDLVGCKMPSTDRIHPEFQSWKPGDKLWMYPSQKFEGVGHARLVRYEPGRVLVFATRQTGTTPPEPYDGSWGFVLEPLDGNTSRLLVRGRAGGPRAFFGAAFDHFVFEPIHFVMERRMMEGIKTYAEGGRTSWGWDLAQLSTWAAAFILMLLSAISVLRGPAWAEALGTYIAACGLFQVLTLVQPSPLLGASLVIGVGVLRWVPRYLWRRNGSTSNAVVHS
jgi:hypothetical protein